MLGFYIVIDGAFLLSNLILLWLQQQTVVCMVESGSCTSEFCMSDVQTRSSVIFF